MSTKAPQAPRIMGQSIVYYIHKNIQYDVLVGWHRADTLAQCAVQLVGQGASRIL